MEYNVCDYGAIPDTAHDSTHAFQEAIDACGNAGGGRVVAGAGTYCIDMITLRDNVELHLESGCTLLSLLDRIPEEGTVYEEPSFNMKRWLIGGVKLTGASITGNGVLDGRGYVNFWNKNDGYEHPLYGQRYWPYTHRPRGLIHFRESVDIRIKDVTILDPPAYCIWMLGCDRCDLCNIRIRTDLYGPNNDGIDIDCCSNILIDGCDIITNDDAVGIFSDINNLGYEKTCENIVVSNCRIKAVSDGVRIGYVGDGPIRNICINNCVIYETMIGISMMVAISPEDARGVYIKYGPRISNVNFNNLVIEAEQTFNFQCPKNGTTRPIVGFMEQVYLRNITAVARRGSYFGGVLEQPLGAIEISGLNMTLTGEMGDQFLDFIPEPYPVWTDMSYDGIPHAFYIRHAGDLVIRDSTIRYKNITGEWHPEWLRKEKSNVEVRNVRVQDVPEKMPVKLFPIDRSGEVARYIFAKENMPTVLLDADCWMLSPYPESKALHAGQSQWDEALLKLAAKGIRSLIVPAVIWKELYWRYYNSSRYHEQKGGAVLEKILKSAEKAGLEVICGTCLSTLFWHPEISDAAFEKELLEYRCALSEIRKFPGIGGFYLPLLPPVNSAVSPEIFAERAAALCENFCRAVKSGAGSQKVIASVLPVGDAPEQYQAILERAGLDEIVVHTSVSGKRSCTLDWNNTLLDS